MNELEKQIKHTGATFTPKKLADFLAKKIFKYLEPTNYPTSVLDPSCGDGELLIAMAELLNHNNINFDLTGCDSNEEYLKDSQQRLLKFSPSNVKLNHVDFLESIDINNTQNQMPIGFFDAVNPTTEKLNNSSDLIIANPPYVRTQILGADRAQNIAKKFNLKGRIDLYYPFLMGMTECLKESGILGVITSNRYLSTKGGESIRQYLVDNYEILEIIDLGDTKLFDAAVLPAIFIGRKKSNVSSGVLKEGKFTKVYEELNGLASTQSATDIYDLLLKKSTGCYSVMDKKFNLSSGSLRYSTGSKSLWKMLSDSETDWVHKIESNSSGKIKDYFKVRVGVKTTADSIFINDNWNEFDITPEEEILYPLISQQNIDKWKLDDKVKLKLLYTHFDIDGKKAVINLEKYPRASKYLNLYRDVLTSRKYVIDANRNWFEIWVPQNPAYWKYPKLVFPDISAEPKFYFDNSGKIVNGNCYWITARNEAELDRLYLLQGIANSSIMTKYHDLVFNNKLYSGRRRYFSQYVENYPLPDEETIASKELISLVKKLNSQCIEHSQNIQAELDNLVSKAFYLTD